MSEQDSGLKWWVRYVFVPLIGGGGLVAVVVAYLNNGPAPPPKEPPQKNITSTGTGPDNTSVEPQPAPLPLSPEQVVADVQTLAARWTRAFLEGNVDEVVSQARVPFYFDKHIALTKSDLRSMYAELVESKRAAWRTLEVGEIQVRTVAEDNDAGRGIPDDLLQQMSLRPTDFIVTVKIGDARKMEDFLVMVRRDGKKYEIAGTTD